MAIASAVLLVLTIWVLAQKPSATAEVACCHGHFLHGIASGEPHARGIVLWTRLTPKNISDSEPLKVHWQIWEESDGVATLAEAVVKGETKALPERDWTIKLDVTSRRLKPKVKYAFQFSAGSELSPVGRFRLPPAAGQHLDSLKYAIFSCSNWRWGYFNAYGAAAHEDLDFWVHVGDYIYEHGRSQYPNDAKEAVRARSVDPEHETVTLDDYRKRHALYRTDVDLQKLAASAPLVPMWDDHEVANDVYKGGAMGHDSKAQGDYMPRMVAGTRAYHEWMPTRQHADFWTDDAQKTGEGAPWMQWRRLDFGDLASLLVLETRLTARTKPNSTIRRAKVSGRIADMMTVAGNPPPEQWAGSELEKQLLALRAEIEVEIRRDDKTMLGKEQLAWVRRQVQTAAKSGTRWQLVAQQTVLQEKKAPNYEKAISEAQANGEQEVTESWKLALANVFKMPDGEKKRKALACLAAGHYDINLSYDDWMGFYADRARLVSALDTGEPTATLVYGGDSHNAWAGTLRDASGKAVAVEFDGMSVSSPGVEFYNSLWPVELEAAAWRASNGDLAWADTHNRGFMLVSLTRETHHVEYRGVETKLPGKSESKCLSAFDVAKGTGPEHADCRDSRKAASFVEAPGLGAQRRGHAGLRRGASPFYLLPNQAPLAL